MSLEFGGKVETWAAEDKKKEVWEIGNPSSNPVRMGTWFGFFFIFSGMFGVILIHGTSVLA